MDASGDQSDEKQAGEKPIGIEEQRTIESQEAQAKEQRLTQDANELPATTIEELLVEARGQGKNEASAKQNVKDKAKPILRDQSTKLFDQFTRHFQVSKEASGNTINMLKKIQKQLTQIDKTTANSNKQQIIIKQLAVQVKAIQKQIDKVGSSVDSIKNIQRKAAIKKRYKK